MDVNNAYLRDLIDRTDSAFKSLLKDPNSHDLQDAYEAAKRDLNQYISSVKQGLPSSPHDNVTR
ncbi:hypothetical protein [Alteromonas oceanisediminis]|uniref:hypothetical protein n=1 Tax=Alteromonas oceanisediminis TaxID=2836180 RepID=UPI001BDA20D4|nr:hypothetical protein [Alteromonas oceanisediminis]MBT0585264.1 hypothetical protein [Alteromonas oceanisediminis]